MLIKLLNKKSIILSIVFLVYYHSMHLFPVVIYKHIHDEVVSVLVPHIAQNSNLVAVHRDAHFLGQQMLVATLWVLLEEVDIKHRASVLYRRGKHDIRPHVGFTIYSLLMADACLGGV